MMAEATIFPKDKVRWLLNDTIAIHQLITNHWHETDVHNYIVTGWVHELLSMYWLPNLNAYVSSSMEHYIWLFHKLQFIAMVLSHS